VRNFYSYSPYGEVTTLGSDDGNSLQYTGRENDQSGLYFYRARYYDPILKRFLSEDPIGIEGGLNLYAYVRGNPLTETDPTGLGEGCDFIPDRFETPCRLICCTFHDRCWQRNQCSMKSWWPPCATPACVKCNLEVVSCFLRCGKDGKGGRGR